MTGREVNGLASNDTLDTTTMVAMQCPSWYSYILLRKANTAALQVGSVQCSLFAT
jgi:hypothetical protein